MNQGILIGRDPSCDICVGDRYENVSRRHARIYQESGNLVFEDMSTNGSYINGQKLSHSQVVLQRGCTIYLGKYYRLDWQDIERFFPSSRSTQLDGRDISGRPTEPFRQFAPQQHVAAAQSYISPGVSHPEVQQQENIDVLLRQWNWGAFGLYQFWGFANGMWWLFLVAVFLGWLFPITNIIMGAKGSRWAWEMKEWRNVEHFKQVQESWKPWGIAIMVLNAFVYIMTLGVMLA